MAKKTTKKLKLAKGAKKKPGPKTVSSKGKAKPVKVTPKNTALPGFEQVRNEVLERAGGHISDCRATMNQARQEELGYKQTAMNEMQAKGLVAYQTSHGVELLLVPGDVKLRVRALKDEADTDSPLVQGLAASDLDDAFGVGSDE